MKLKESVSKDIDPKQLDELFIAIGWRPRGNKKWKEVLNKSYLVYSVWHDKKLIGFGRIMEDGIMCMFYDIGVHPDYQNRGIGKHIMKNLIKFVKNKKYASIGLFGWEKNPNNIPFYENFGFVRVPNGMELVKYMNRE